MPDLEEHLKKLIGELVFSNAALTIELEQTRAALENLKLQLAGVKEKLECETK